MTLQEWRAAHPRAAVEPTKDAPDVITVSVGDPFLEHRQPDPTIARELAGLSDYMLTSELPMRGTYWLAPKVDRDDWTRTDYMAARCSHEAYYLSLARLIGYEAIARLVLSYVANRERLARYAADPHLNNIPLARWDALHGFILQMVSEQNRSKGIMARSWCGQPLQPGAICWSLSESVCVAKAVARHLIDNEVTA